MFVSVFFYVNAGKTSFEVNRVLIKSVIKEGESLNSTLKMTNLGEKKNFEIEILDLKNLISLNEKNFVLDGGESKETIVSFNSENSPPDVYAGSLIIKAEKEKKKIPIILEVQTLNQYFAINLDIDPKYKETQRSENLVFNVNFFNLKDSEMRSVEMEYKMINEFGETLISEKETLVVGSKSSVAKSILIPKGIKSGNYALAVTLKSRDSVSTSSYLFEVSGIKIPLGINLNVFHISVLVLLLAVVMIIIYIMYIYKSLRSFELGHELKTKMSALKNAYSQGFISKKSYKKGKSRIEYAKRKIK